MLRPITRGGRAYGNLGKNKKAISDFTKAIKINPNYAKAFNNRAAGYFYTKNYVKSWQDVLTAEKLGYNTKFTRSLLKVQNKEI